MTKGFMANGVNTWFQKGDTVNIKHVDEKSQLVLVQNIKNKKQQWLFAKDVWFVR